MGLLSHKVERSDLEPGDHVYVYRGGVGIYSHHGNYVGNGMVVHLIVDNFSSSSNCSASCSSSSSSDEHGCGSRKDGSAVTMTCLDCFLKKGSLRRYEYGVSKAAFIMVKHRPGTCTMAESDDAEKVIHRAMYLLENGFGEYHLLKNNCEVFAIYCKTGFLSYKQRTCSSALGGRFWQAGPASSALEGCFGQATTAVLAPTGVVNFGGTGLFAGGLAIAALELPLIAAFPVAGVVGGAVASGVNIAARYTHDISRRHDIREVEVERLQEFRRTQSARY
ncbi:hypothetical protein C2S51_014546 [Perilla frutescens var. frutescens]|nr:hypothetical protein C2S51_014546 [Perilla frutescens var. frutescens]